MTNVDPPAKREPLTKQLGIPPTGRLKWAFTTLSEGAEEDPGILAGATAVAAALLVGLSRLIHMFTIDSRHLLVAWIGVSTVCLIAIACLTLLGALFWQTRMTSGSPGAYALTLISSLLAISVCVEAFAGITTLLWHHGVIAPEANTGASLWAGEHFYLWQLADSIPLLNIPSTLGWTNPLSMSDGVSGGVLLAFKIIVIAPLIRLAIGAYQFIETHSIEERGRRYELSQRVPTDDAQTPWPLPPTGVWPTFLTLFGITCAGFAAAFFLVEPQSPVPHWIVSHTPDGFTVSGHDVSLGWLPHALPWAAVAILLRCLYSADEAMWSIRMVWLDRVSKVLAATLSQLCFIALIVATVAAATVALANAGVTMFDPRVTGGSVLGAALTAYLWHVVDALPGPDIPQTLNWTLPHDLTGTTSGAALLILEVTIFAILIFPIARAARIYLHHARPRPVVRAALSAAREFGERCVVAQTTMDSYERDITARWRNRPTLPDSIDHLANAVATTTGENTEETGNPDASTTRSLPLARSPFGPSWNVRWDASQAVTAVVESLDQVTELFGRGDLSTAAELAARALRSRYDRLTTVSSWPGGPTLSPFQVTSSRLNRHPEPTVEQLTQLRADAEAAIRAYTEAAVDLLRREAEAARVTD